MISASANAAALLDEVKRLESQRAELLAINAKLLAALLLHDHGCRCMVTEPDCECVGCRTRAAIAFAIAKGQTP